MEMCEFLWEWSFKKKAHERTFCLITPYVTLVTLPCLPPILPPNTPHHLPLSHSHESEEKMAHRLSCWAHILSSPHVIFPLISRREWLPRHVPKGSTSSESSWRSRSAGSRFTAKDQGWVACQRSGGPVAELRSEAPASCRAVNLQCRTSRGQTLARFSSQRLPGPPSCKPAWHGLTYWCNCSTCARGGWFTKAALQ